MMKEKIDKIDKAKDEEFDKICKEKANTSTFVRLLEYNTPYFFVFLACIGSAMVGAPQSLFAIIFGRILGLLTMPMQQYILLKVDGEFIYASEDRKYLGIDWYWYQAIAMVLIMIGVGVVSFIGAVMQF